MNANLRPSDLPNPVLLRGGVRMLDRADIPQIARLFLGKFRDRPNAHSPRLEEHLSRFFLDHPHYDDATASLVHEEPDGRLSGFLGSAPINLMFDGKSYMGSIISAWMIEHADRDSRAAVALARAHLGRGHYLTMTDTASRHSIGFHALLRMQFAAAHSLRWMKPLNFAATSLLKAADAVGLPAPAAALAAARACERAARRVARRSGASQMDGWRIDAIPVQRLAEAFHDLTGRMRLAPALSDADLDWLLDFARAREGTTDLVSCEARDRTGARAGACVYRIDDKGRAEIVQIVLRPRAEESVLRLVINHARANGAISIGGRIDPAVSLGLFAIPRVLYFHGPGVCVKTADPDAFRAISAGEGLIGGFVGDAWTPLSSDLYA